MQAIHDGQCGLCAHFGEHQPQDKPVVLQVRVSRNAPDDLVEQCGHPQHEALNLMVTANSGCQGFTPAKPN
ncbi:MAG TPA: hypothetical protein VH475_20460 [Tepidisphaeraceae bacterium]|jgi:hypothetical protein